MVEKESKMEYETIKSKRSKFGFPKSLWFDFSPEKSDEIIKNLVNRIEEYERAREMETKYESTIDKKGNQRIIKAKIQSSNGLVKGEINYEPPGTEGFLHVGFNHNARINAEFHFESTDPNDMEEYLGLVRIIKSL